MNKTFVMRVVTVFTLLVVGISTPAFAECSDQSLQGAYGFSLNGTNYNRDLPWAFVGQFETDSAGKFAGSGTQSTKGQVVRGKFTGTYRVASDCSGEAALTFENGIKATLHFVIVDSGRRVELIVGDQGTLEIGAATKIVTVPLQSAHK